MGVVPHSRKERLFYNVPNVISIFVKSVMHSCMMVFLIVRVVSVHKQVFVQCIPRLCLHSKHTTIGK